MTLPFLVLWKFPNLVVGEYERASDATDNYNCIAWAIGDTTQWWSPEDRAYWPSEVPREETVDAFVAVFRLYGYELCDSLELEEQFEKVAIYADPHGPTHVALQKPNGVWSSKLGDWEDIEHKLHGLEGSAERRGYGRVVAVLRRLRGG